MTEFYNILNLHTDADLSAIKSAYKKLAKLWHPDINKHPEAKEKFQKIVEAYEVLVAYKSGKITEEQLNPTQQEPTYEDVVENIRKKAHAYSNMSFEEFRKTEVYQSSFYRFVFWNHLYIFSVILIPILPFTGYIYNGALGLIAPTACVLILTPYWLGIKKRIQYFNLTQFKASLQYLIQYSSTQLILVILVNIVLFFNTTIKTIVPTFSFLLIGLSSFLFLFFASFIKKMSWTKRALVAFGCITFINCLLLINRIASSDTIPEIYKYTPTLERTGNYTTSTTLIKLQGNTYQNTPHIRVFNDYYTVSNNNYIVYFISEGLFGFKYVHNYQFLKSL